MILLNQMQLGIDYNVDPIKILQEIKIPVQGGTGSQNPTYR